jgi:hypothetical protein
MSYGVPPLRKARAVMSKTDFVLSNLKTGELGEADYLRFVLDHSAAVSESLQKLGKYLQNVRPQESWCLCVNTTGTQLLKLTTAVSGVKPPRRWRKMYKKYLKTMKLIEESLSLVGRMLIDKGAIDRAIKKLAEASRSIVSVREAFPQITMVGGLSNAI